MNFFDYIGISKERFVEDYLVTGLIQEAVHKEFPLNLFTYTRKTVHKNQWDGVTSKCRGIIVHRDTGEIIARPFEKFHNYGSTLEESTWSGLLPEEKPWVMEKVDGFMCTAYRWNGKWYVASKGSFHSIHAKWATIEFQKTATFGFPKGYTPVLEGLCRDLRVVVDYGTRTGLVLLALINNETGAELKPDVFGRWAVVNSLTSPRVFEMTLDEAARPQTGDGSEEGYVLTWYREGQPPYRLKVKFIEYLRLHRMVTGVSPKRIWEALSQPHLKAYITEYTTQSTPWFKKFVTKWILALQGEFDRLNGEAHTRYQCAQIMLKDFCQKNWDNPADIRKAYALEFTKPENKEFSSILFAKLDNKDVNAVIWKKVRKMTENGRPMVDAHNT